MVDSVTSVGSALQALGAFAAAHVAAIPEAALAGLIADLGLPSPVDRIINGCERVYALGLADMTGDDQTAAATVTAQLASFAILNGWHALGQTSRGPLMVGACRRILGEDGADQDPALDPERLAEYVAPTDG